METWNLKKKKSTVRAGIPSKARTRLAGLLLLLATLAVAVYDFPVLWNRSAEFVQAKTGWAAPSIPDESYRLGLDLQGGTHLVYEADMSQIAESERDVALEGVRDVIERRVNAFGVSEPLVQTTTTGGSYRVIVELAGVLDVKEAIKQIGETPILEFKVVGEQLDREPTPEELAQLDERQLADRAKAEDVLKQVKNGQEPSLDGQSLSWEPVTNVSTANDLLVDFAQEILDAGLKQGSAPVILETEDALRIVRVTAVRQSEEMLLSHILVCFEGKTACQDPIPAIEGNIQITNAANEATPENFAEVAGRYTVDAGAMDGDLGWIAPGETVPAFEIAALALPVGSISSTVETDFGYHLIYKRESRPLTVYDVEVLSLPFTTIYDILPPSSPWKNTGLSGKELKRSSVQFDPNSGVPIVALDFNPEGAELFGQLTAENIGKPIAIFLDGSPISTPTVQQAIYGGQAIISGNFGVEEARTLAQRLNAGALPVPVHLLSQETIGPTLGAASLEMSLKAALVGFALVAAYMIAYYRLAGLFSVMGLVLYAFLNLAVYRLFNVTISLAGIAGFVLSMGMAVDANVLIIERMKEEWAGGRDFNGTIREGFARAWPAIRDGNATTLVSALVLYAFSTSFVRGFALMLAIGVCMSVVTAIWIVRIWMTGFFPVSTLKIPAISGLSKKQKA